MGVCGHLADSLRTDLDQQAAPTGALTPAEASTAHLLQTRDRPGVRRWPAGAAHPGFGRKPARREPAADRGASRATLRRSVPSRRPRAPRRRTERRRCAGRPAPPSRGRAACRGCPAAVRRPRNGSAGAGRSGLARTGMAARHSDSTIAGPIAAPAVNAAWRDRLSPPQLLPSSTEPSTGGTLASRPLPHRSADPSAHRSALAGALGKPVGRD